MSATGLQAISRSPFWFLLSAKLLSIFCFLWLSHHRARTGCQIVSVLNLVLLTVVAYQARRLQDHSHLSHPISSSSTGNPASLSSPQPALTTVAPARLSTQTEIPA